MTSPIQQFDSDQKTESIVFELHTTPSGTLVRLVPADPTTETGSTRLVATGTGGDPEELCESFFEKLATESPRRLVALIEGDDGKYLSRVNLFFAAKAAAIAPSHLVEGVLLNLLKHHSPLVREGAVYGLSGNKSPQIQRTLQRIAEFDPNEGVRNAAGDFVDPA